MGTGPVTVARIRYYDAGGNPVTITNGYAVMEVYTNAEGRKVGEAYFDSSLNPVYRKRTAYAGFMVENRDDGVTVTSYYDRNGNIVKTEQK